MGQALRVHRNAVENGKLRPLHPWEMALAEFLVQRFPAERYNRPDYEYLVSQALALGAPETVDEQVLRKLIRRDASFKRYKELFENDILAALRNRVVSHVPEFVDAHVKGLRGAIAEEDWRGVATYTQPMIDRVLPKREDNPPVVAVQVLLNQRRADAMDAAPPEVTAELIEPDA